jgi:bacillithiol system protein YtxJ
MSSLSHLTDVAGLDAALDESHERPVLLFKHSRTCGVSCEALDQLHTHVDAGGVDAAYKVITVQSHRRLADEVTMRLGIRHETPQAILLRGGQPVWSASHFRVTARQLDAVLSPLER